MLVYIYRHRLVGTACFLFILITLAFSAWRIFETSRWLQRLRDYVEARDAQWNPVMQKVMKDQDAIMKRQAELLDRIESR